MCVCGGMHVYDTVLAIHHSGNFACMGILLSPHASQSLVSPIKSWSGYILNGSWNVNRDFRMGPFMKAKTLATSAMCVQQTNVALYHSHASCSALHLNVYSPPLTPFPPLPHFPSHPFTTSYFHTPSLSPLPVLH